MCAALALALSRPGLVSFSDVLAAFDAVDAATAEATVESDRAHIFARVQRMSGGFGTFNSTVRRRPVCHEGGCAAAEGGSSVVA